jgi:hypothetical protein
VSSSPRGAATFRRARRYTIVPEAAEPARRSVLGDGASARATTAPLPAAASDGRALAGAGTPPLLRVRRSPTPSRRRRARSPRRCR